VLHLSKLAPAALRGGSIIGATCLYAIMGTGELE